MSVNENLRLLTINISPALEGQGVRRQRLFFVALEGRQLCVCRQSSFDASRVLLAEGIDLETPIVALPSGADFDAVTSPVGEADSQIIFKAVRLRAHEVENLRLVLEMQDGGGAA